METYDGPLPDGITLLDASEDINRRVNAALQTARATAKGTLPAAVYNALGSTMTHLAPIESWANGLAPARPGSPGKIYTFDIAQTPYRDSSPMGGLAPVLSVNGLLIGTDKLGHFFQLGYSHYFQKLVGRDRLPRGQVLSEGDETERGLFGLDLTGVYSKADIAANRAGLAFYEKLADNRTLVFDIRDYVTRDWNEQWNPNDFKSGMWRESLPGSWSGTFEWYNSSTKSRAPVHATISVTSGSLENLRKGIFLVNGWYRYVHPLASDTSGELSGEVLPKKTETGAVTQLDMALTWKEGRAAGRGKLTMWTFTRMDGSWGRGDSESDGGGWAFLKV
jgi:hypothetical protein